MKTLKVTDVTKAGVGDVDYNNIGQLKVIEDRDKLSQDILEILLVMKGERDVPRMSPTYGSDIMKIMGYPLSGGGLETLLCSAIDDAIINLKTIQAKHSKLSPKEKVSRVVALDVRRDSGGLGYRFYLEVDTTSKDKLTVEGNLD